MNVYGEIRKAVQEFESADFWDEESVNNEKVLKTIIGSWAYLEPFVKNINPEHTKYLSDRLQTITHSELLITREMLREAKRRFDRLRAEVNDVKSFVRTYIWLIDSLLKFNIPEEACEICQSYLYYYFSEKNQILIKQCVTCGTQYDGIGNKIPLAEHYKDLRPAKKQELEPIIRLTEFRCPNYS